MRQRHSTRHGGHSGFTEAILFVLAAFSLCMSQCSKADDLDDLRMQQISDTDDLTRVIETRTESCADLRAELRQARIKALQWKRELDAKNHAAASSRE